MEVGGKYAVSCIDKVEAVDLGGAAHADAHALSPFERRAAFAVVGIAVHTCPRDLARVRGQVCFDGERVFVYENDGAALVTERRIGIGKRADGVGGGSTRARSTRGKKDGLFACADRKQANRGKQKEDETEKQAFTHKKVPPK